MRGLDFLHLLGTQHDSIGIKDEREAVLFDQAQTEHTFVECSGFSALVIGTKATMLVEPSTSTLLQINFLLAAIRN